MMVHLIICYVYTGFYMYMEASNQNPGDEALLGTPELTQGGPYCVQFYYHIFGNHIGQLQVEELTGSDSANPLATTVVATYPLEGERKPT